MQNNQFIFRRAISIFYKKNKDNFIGRWARAIRRLANFLMGKGLVGNKNDLRYLEAGKGIFNKTKRIAIELSNRCNYASIHKKCPLSLAGEPKIMPEKIVYHILETCQKYDYNGYIAFDIYNESGIDPRLMMFIKRTKDMLPKVQVVLQSNGYYMTQSLAEEYEKNGVSIIRVSAYTPDEQKRLSNIKLEIPFVVTSIVLDNRMEWYSRSEINSNKPCGAPLKELLITCDGKISLCCFEWKRENTFGDLNSQTLEEVLQGKEIREVYERLSKGDRFFDLCKRCSTSR